MFLEHTTSLTQTKNKRKQQKKIFKKLYKNILYPEGLNFNPTKKNLVVQETSKDL